LYISTVGSNGFVNADPNGTTQTLLVGAPRQYFVTLKARF
jgi:iron complex outermembrane receptor protein